MTYAYRVRARNTATESENKIHEDRVAAQYGFRGGLVPGVTVYGYMTVPVVERFSRAWLERGSMRVKFQQPFYDGDEVIAKMDAEGHVTAEREDGTVCATGTASLTNPMDPDGPWPEHPLPPLDARPQASRESIVPGAPLGTLVVTAGAEADPEFLLGLSNDILIRNFVLSPWIHTASELTNYSVAGRRDEISVRGRIHDRYDRKGREFVVADLMLLAGDRPIQRVRHTAIYRLRRDS